MSFSQKHKHFFLNILAFIFSIVFLQLTSCSKAKTENMNHVSMSLGKPVNTLDPVLANDTTSQYICGAFYDTLLQYHYDEGTYRLEPCMLTKMPEVSADGKSYTCILRDDLYFQDGPAHANLTKEQRKVTAQDVAFSILRLADSRLRSSGYWLIRDKITGLESFRDATSKVQNNDLKPYDSSCSGLEIKDEKTIIFHLTAPDPRFLYALALPYTAIVSRRAVEHYGPTFAEHPEGSGPFRLAKWERNYVIELNKYNDYHAEHDGRILPATETITCYLVKQPVASWLMFLQGRLDYYSPDTECFEAVVDNNLQLSPSLKKRGIRLLSRMQLETNYIGFNFNDPILGKNLHLRRAISYAFDKKERIIHSGQRFSVAVGPIPPGIDGAEEPVSQESGLPNLTKAKEELALAGFPNGLDSKTGERLSLTFDQTGSDTFYRQTAELLANDLKQIGINVQPEFNTRPRFEQKLKQGNIQLFRYSWTADYPDAENFLQLFYGENAGSCNRVSYRDSQYDKMYEDFIAEMNPEEYTKKAHAMTAYLQGQTPWIFESHTMCFVLAHEWLSGYCPHDFAFNRWKYLSVDYEKRNRMTNSFTPIEMNELNHH